MGKLTYSLPFVLTNLVEMDERNFSKLATLLSSNSSQNLATGYESFYSNETLKTTGLGHMCN